MTQDSQRKEPLSSLMARLRFLHGVEHTDLAALKRERIKAHNGNRPTSLVIRRMAMTARVVTGKPQGLGTREAHTLEHTA